MKVYLCSLGCGQIDRYFQGHLGSFHKFGTSLLITVTKPETCSVRCKGSNLAFLYLSWGKSSAGKNVTWLFSRYLWFKSSAAIPNAVNDSSVKKASPLSGSVTLLYFKFLLSEILNLYPFELSVSLHLELSKHERLPIEPKLAATLKNSIIPHLLSDMILKTPPSGCRVVT